ncbi:MAG: histidine kinase [Gallionellaceae bacterium]|jgi:two-component system sensor histidine kinase AlgZ|nr:histidine kinase [Gallionellaceae bacterium]
MNEARSIKQNTSPDMLPNFRNLGVTLRILLISSGLTLLQSLLLANSWSDVPAHMMRATSMLTPALLSCLLIIWAIQPWLNRLPYRYGVLAINTLAAILTLSIYYAGGELYRIADRSNLYFDAMHYTLSSVLLCSIVLLYFHRRSFILSHSLMEARQQALRARIRPHFLFNTINAVLSIVRAQPKQAEAALQDMADLFRAAMVDAQDLVPLRREIELSQQYISLEQLRMGERLRVVWQMHDVPGEVLIPHLLLQPLLENAVYHGIESLPQGGCINIWLRHSGDKLRLKIENPCAPRNAAPHSGNKMALQNIRERLALLFDAEARYQVESGPDFYRVEITMPYLKEKAK